MTKQDILTVYVKKHLGLENDNWNIKECEHRDDVIYIALEHNLLPIWFANTFSTNAGDDAAIFKFNKDFIAYKNTPPQSIQDDNDNWYFKGSYDFRTGEWYMQHPMDDKKKIYQSDEQEIKLIKGFLNIKDK